MSEVLDPPLATAVQTAVDDVDAALDRLHELDLWALGSDELIEATGGLQRLRAAQSR